MNKSRVIMKNIPGELCPPRISYPQYGSSIQNVLPEPGEVMTP